MLVIQLLFSIRWSDRFHCYCHVYCFLHRPGIVWLAFPSIYLFLTVGSGCVVACRSAVFESPKVLEVVLCVLPIIFPCPFSKLRVCILRSFLHYLDGKYRF
jgi:hypothetical protein